MVRRFRKISPAGIWQPRSFVPPRMTVNQGFCATTSRGNRRAMSAVNSPHTPLTFTTARSPRRPWRKPPYGASSASASSRVGERNPAVKLSPKQMIESGWDGMSLLRQGAHEGPLLDLLSGRCHLRRDHAGKVYADNHAI